jgi:hypothetical protein
MKRTTRGQSPLLVCPSVMGPLIERAKKHKGGQKPDTRARL